MGINNKVGTAHTVIMIFKKLPQAAAHAGRVLYFIFICTYLHYIIVSIHSTILKINSLFSKFCIFTYIALISQKKTV